MTLFYRWLLCWLLLSPSSSAIAADELPLGPMPISLKHLPVPEVPGLLDGPDPIVVDKTAAIALGKALFWDANVGSDGMACASCHFHAGADRRIKNQMAPSGQSGPIDQDFSGFAANRTLGIDDFPLHRRQDPLQELSPVVLDSDVVIGSAGTFGGEYRGVDLDDSGIEDCQRTVDEIFHVGPYGTRRVTSRNAPSVINSVFNHRNFWDGRANHIFNGSSPWGDRDPDAGVWVMNKEGTVSKQRLHLLNASLASLATSPPLNTNEMSCSQRSLPDIGRKLLHRRPLARQKVHWNDSVLGRWSPSRPGKLLPGLETTYEALIKKAFNRKFWSYEGAGEFGGPLKGQAYRQIEANFAMFFGLAIQLYESTLISDESPFDNSRRDANNVPVDLSESELRGLTQFRLNLCSHCHLGPNFTSASVNANAALAKARPEVFGEPGNKISTTTNVVNRIPVFARNKAMLVFSDTGFASTGVAKEAADIGLGGVDVFGTPLSFSEQYFQYLAGNDTGVKDDAVRQVRACDFQAPFAINFEPPYIATSLFTVADGIRPIRANLSA
ncbi:cytochrome-c peroxidase [Methylohalobius crimeensis]|uniref:cytochrome-c peroxidase n=1 Tax=Methylohalobius crimeensis TaxID=244365 RepID=UPI0003B65F81|nr:cytochrome-c peroxidase [Methylohalobius crimeensis]